MSVIALRPRRHGRTQGAGPVPHPVVEGSFRSPSGNEGRFSGALRLERLLVTPHGAYVSGVVTGALADASGAGVGRDSRQVTAAADLVLAAGSLTAVVRPFDVDMMGIPVHVASFAIDPGLDPLAPRRPGGAVQRRTPQGWRR